MARVGVEMSPDTVCNCGHRRLDHATEAGNQDHPDCLREKDECTMCICMEFEAAR